MLTLGVIVTIVIVAVLANRYIRHITNSADITKKGK